MWWVADHGHDNIGDDSITPINLPDGSFAAEGAYGQYCIVIPDYDLVIVHRVNSDINNNVSDMEFGILLYYILSARPM